MFALSNNEHVLLRLLHHIASDGWSLAPLTRDIAIAHMSTLASTLKPANARRLYPFGPCLENLGVKEMRGSPGRILTSNQTDMSA